MRYLNHVGIMDNGISRKFAMMLIRNAQLPDDTTNTVGMQLAMLEQSKDNKHRVANISIPHGDVIEVLKVMKSSGVSSASESNQGA